MISAKLHAGKILIAHAHWDIEDSSENGKLNTDGWIFGYIFPAEDQGVD